MHGNKKCVIAFVNIIVLFFSVSLFSRAVAGIDLVKVDKSASKMYLIENKQIIKEYHVAFGANPKGHKQQEGDEKTPEGTYTLDYKK